MQKLIIHSFILSVSHTLGLFLTAKPKADSVWSTPLNWLCTQAKLKARSERFVFTFLSLQVIGSSEKQSLSFFSFIKHTYIETLKKCYMMFLK